MRILIIGPGKLKYMPYAHFYLDSIDLVANDIHLAYWNRDEKEEDLSVYPDITLHEFKAFMVNDASIKTKLRMFKRYRAFCAEIIAKYDYDFIIALHSLSGLMILDLLRIRYKNRYILDYRDSTYETISLFRYFIALLVKWSKVTFVSSDAFRRYLPSKYSNKIYTSHNLLEDSLLHREDAQVYKIQSDKIRIAFWGFIRHVEINKILIDRIAADNRFELHYYGREQKDAIELKEYIRTNNLQNVYFHGEYNPCQRYDFVKVTDIIHNLYYDTNMLLAMGNKYYDSIIFRIPLLSMPGSYMANRSVDNSVGFELDPNDEAFADKLYTIYNNLDRDKYNRNCDVELNKILKEYYEGKEIISTILRG